jgi:hypothetical protein
MGQHQGVTPEHGEELDPVLEMTVAAEPGGHSCTGIEKAAVDHGDGRVQQIRIVGEWEHRAVPGEHEPGPLRAGSPDSPPEGGGGVMHTKTPRPSAPCERDRVPGSGSDQGVGEVDPAPYAVEVRPDLQGVE